MKKWLILILIIFFLPVVIADKGEIEIYKPNEVFDLSIHLSNRTGNVLGANCQAEIRNKSYGVIATITLNEVDGGWYNGTYNTSKVGKYFCRQNCTQGSFFAAETCDFVIGVDDNMALGMLIFIPLFIAGFLLVVSWMLDPEKYWAMKLGLILAGFVFVFQAYHFNNLVISEFFGSTNITNAIGDATWIYGMFFVSLFFIFLITFIYDIFMLFSNRKHKTGDP